MLLLFLNTNTTHDAGAKTKKKKGPDLSKLYAAPLFFKLTDIIYFRKSDKQVHS